MKIVQINASYNIGSTGRIVEGIAEAARRRGHEALAVYGRRAEGGPTGTYRVGSWPDQWMHGFYSFMADGHGLASRNPTMRLLQWFEQEKPDVVGLHNLHGYYLNVPILFDRLRQNRIPVVWTLHDCWSFTGHCAHFVRFNCLKWQTECSTCPMTGYYPRSLIDCSTRNHRWKKHAFRHLDNMTIVTPSRWLADHVARSFLADYPLQVIPNGIDLEKFRPVASTRPDRITILGVANQWSDGKGLPEFTRLRALLPRDWRIVLVGVTRTQKKALPEGLCGIERTESIEDLVRLYSEASVYVNPTKADNFPTTNLEALACGTPVVTYRTGGSPESVPEGCGAVVEQGDIQALAQAVRTIGLLDFESMAARCRNTATAKYNQKHRFDEYIKLCEGLAS